MSTVFPPSFHYFGTPSNFTSGNSIDMYNCCKLWPEPPGSCSSAGCRCSAPLAFSSASAALFSRCKQAPRSCQASFPEFQDVPSFCCDSFCKSCPMCFFTCWTCCVTMSENVGLRFWFTHTWAKRAFLTWNGLLLPPMYPLILGTMDQKYSKMINRNKKYWAFTTASQEPARIAHCLAHTPLYTSKPPWILVEPCHVLWGWIKSTSFGDYSSPWAPVLWQGFVPGQNDFIQVAYNHQSSTASKQSS